ncbi:MAG TPA: GNAT family N-acetyltransferase [Acidimicrobiales bacterium]|nr:GNAT family N-acetyltransferase [Acidimicrobiales bacterium]
MTTVETDRLILRPWAEGDLGPLAAIFAEPAFWRYPFGRGFTRVETEQFLERQFEHWATHGFGSWAAELKDGHRLIGYIGLAVPTWLPQVMPAVEVGWRLHPDHWGRGLATEGGRASVRHGFDELGLDRIIAIVQPKNVASRRVIAKLGMVAVSTTRDAAREVDLEVHEISGATWAVRNAHDWFEVNSGWAPPEEDELAEWLADGVCKSPDDCFVSPDGWCRHGLASWALILRALDD